MMTNNLHYFPQSCRFTLDLQSGELCQIEQIRPNKEFQAFIYIIGSGQKQYRLSDYTLIPECFTTFTEVSIEPIDPFPDTPIPTYDQKEISISSELQSLDQKVQLYRVTVAVNDVINRDQIVQISFFQDKSIKNEPPFLASLPTTPEIIPCLMENAAHRWTYSLPRAIDIEETSIKIAIQCLLLDLNFFKQIIADQVLTLALNTEARDVATGLYSCQLLIEDTDGLQATYTIVFEKICENPFGQSAENQNQLGIMSLQQQVVIKSISKYGVLTLEWPESFRQINPQLTISQLLNITVVPGNNSDPLAASLVSFTNTTYQDRFMKIQLEFHTPVLISADQTSKDRLIVSLNLSDFSIMAQNEIKNLSSVIPRQVGRGAINIDKMEAVCAVIKNASLILLVLQNPVTQYLLQLLLGMVKTLGPITHFILFNLEYPLNLQEFIGYIIPLITFDLIQTDELYEFIFRVSRFDDGPFTEQFELAGYTNMLLINNIGSVLLLIVAQPLSCIVCKIVLRLTRDRSDKISMKLRKFCQKQLDNLFWNNIISFYTEAYLFLSFIGWLQMKDQRFDSIQTSTEHYSTFLGYILVAFSLTWPITMHITLAKKFKPDFPPMQQLTLTKLHSQGTLDQFIGKFHTQEQRQEYLDKYGAQLVDFCLDSRLFGIHSVLLIKDLMFFAQNMLVIIIQFDNRFEKTGLLGIQVILLLQLALLVILKPFKSRLKMATEILNLCTQQYLTYVMIVYTPFVPDHEVRQSAGNQFIYVTLVNIGINIALGLYPGVRKLNMTIKKKYKIYVNKKNKSIVIEKRLAYQLERNIQDQIKATEKAEQDQQLNNQIIELQVDNLAESEHLNAPPSILKKRQNHEDGNSIGDQLVLAQDFEVQSSQHAVKWWDNNQQQQKSQLLQPTVQEQQESSSNPGKIQVIPITRLELSQKQSDEGSSESSFTPYKPSSNLTKKNNMPINNQSQSVYNQIDDRQLKSYYSVSYRSDSISQNIQNDSRSIKSQEKMQHPQRSYVDHLSSESDALSIQEFRASGDYAFTSCEERREAKLLKATIRLVDMSNRDNWQRSEDRAFIPDPKASREQMEREASAYCEYIKSRLIVTQWDRYPHFEGHIDLTYQCVKAHSSTLNLIKERNPTPEQRQVIAEQLHEVRIEVAKKIEAGIIKPTWQLLREFKVEIQEIKREW